MWRKCWRRCEPSGVTYMPPARSRPGLIEHVHNEQQQRILRLDNFGVAEYEGLHGVGSSVSSRCLGRESHNWWLGTPRAVQPTFTPESRHRFRFHRKRYCLDHIARHLSMNALFKDPVGWSERAVGSWPRFILSASAFLVGFLYLCWKLEWRYAFPLAFFVFLMPLFCLIALRGVLRELHRKPESHESVVS